jgi:Tfp pilus assembly protein PilF
VAHCLNSQGKHSEALPLLQRALVIRLAVLGEQHPDTAHSYNNVALCLNSQGKHADALPLHQRALAIHRKALGEQHPDTAQSYNNLAFCLSRQGKHSEALPLLQRALAIYRKVLGEQHPDTADSYNNVASCLYFQGKPAQALSLLRRTLDIQLRVRGDQHPHTANSYNNVAFCLDDQGKHTEALPLHQRALAIRRKALGEQHPQTASSYNNLAHCLNRQGKHEEAVRYWEAALLGYECGRLFAGQSGFDRARFNEGVISPRACLAACLVRLGQPVRAWHHAESDLARGLLDDLSPTSKQDTADLQRLVWLRRLDQDLLPLLTRSGLTTQQKKQRDELSGQRDQLLRELARGTTRRARERVLSLERIVKQVPAETALVFWLEALDQHLGCVLRSDGKPVWVALPGSGKANAWTKEDDNRTGQGHLMLFGPYLRPDEQEAILANAGSDLRRQLAREAFNPDRRDAILAAAYKQRLAPLEPYLKGVKHLIVVPAGRMSALPVEALSDRYTLSYTPSASVFARQREQHRKLEGTSLLVLADPTFERTPEKVPAPPSHGLVVTAIVPGGLAARSGIRAGDVLLSYDGKPLRKPTDFTEVEGAGRVVLKLWRDGQELAGRIPAGKLSVVLDRRGVAEALAAWRQQESKLLALDRGDRFAPLPGTRLEARLLKELVPSATLLLGSAASQQQLDRLASADALKRYRLLHLATHAQAYHDCPEQSALILAQDSLPTHRQRTEMVLQGMEPPDGTLTVQTIRARWKLDADLVVLSACQTGLGAYTDREGMLGFAHALQQSGARSVLLSRWKVDDAATALLMMRFYQNLLGKRQGLKTGLPRAEALHEAKSWLRHLTRGDAERLLAGLLDGVPRGERGSIKKALPLRKPAATTAVVKDERPFAAPYFWAAFVLIGDPD